MCVLCAKERCSTVWGGSGQNLNGQVYGGSCEMLNELGRVNARLNSTHFEPFIKVHKIVFLPVGSTHLCI